MERASCSRALRVRRGVAVSSFSVGMEGIASEGENEGAGGSFTRDNAIMPQHFSSFRAAMVWSRRVWLRLRFEWEGWLAAVVAALARGLPWNRSKGALEEGVVDDVALVVFSFDDPVTGIGFALSG